MCQGVIVSLVKFKVGRQTKRIVLTGIGSHSDLVADNQKKLKRLGWKDSCKSQAVFSIESDFSGWNKFTVESGKPSKNELRILASAYKKVAGNASALLRHVKRCGTVDDALVNLLTGEARRKYNEATAPAWKAYYDEAIAPAWCKLFSVKLNRVPHLQ